MPLPPTSPRESRWTRKGLVGRFPSLQKHAFTSHVSYYHLYFFFFFCLFFSFQAFFFFFSLSFSWILRDSTIRRRHHLISFFSVFIWSWPTCPSHSRFSPISLFSTFSGGFHFLVLIFNISFRLLGSCRLASLRPLFVGENSLDRLSDTLAHTLSFTGTFSVLAWR